MRIVDFLADADLVGRRVRLSWTFRLEPGDTLADVPRVSLRRKQRDFEFPDPPAVGDDPFLAYDSAGFDAASFPVSVGPDPRPADLPDREIIDADGRTVTGTTTVSIQVGNYRVESLRRTVSTRFGIDGAAVSRTVEIVDTGPKPEGLSPGVTYYYQLSSPLLGLVADLSPYRATATPTDSFGLNRTLYEQLPSVYRRNDAATRPPTPGAEGIPEASPSGGQLRRLIDVFGVALDSLRGTAEGLRGLHDVDRADHRRLPLFASWIGWDLSYDAPVPIRRHEIKYAAALYRITGTIPGCRIWVKRLTGWDSRIKEFYRNVFFTNDVGDPDDPDDNGSRTVDTADLARLSRIGTFDDSLDYTYDTGTTDQDWYAYNVVGIFVRPNVGETAAVVARKKDRLANNFSLFLPFNVRGVVIVEVETVPDAQDDEVNLLQGASESA